MRHNCTCSGWCLTKTFLLFVRQMHSTFWTVTNVCTLYLHTCTCTLYVYNSDYSFVYTCAFKCVCTIRSIKCCYNEALALCKEKLGTKGHIFANAVHYKVILCTVIDVHTVGLIAASTAVRKMLVNRNTCTCNFTVCVRNCITLASSKLHPLFTMKVPWNTFWANSCEKDTC